MAKYKEPMGDGPFLRFPKHWCGPHKFPKFSVELAGDKWTTMFFLGMFVCLIIMSLLGYFTGWKVRDLQVENEVLRYHLITDDEEEEEACDVQLRSTSQAETR
jgi:hypothetical protein